MKDIKNIREDYNKCIISKITDYVRKNELVLSNVLCDVNETDKMVKKLQIEKVS